MKLLLVGGTGVLSSAVAETALAKGHYVTMINRGNHKVYPGCEQIVSDRHNYKLIEKYLDSRHFDVVVDFLVFNREDSTSSFGFYSRFCDQYILISSCFVYDFSQGGTMKEDSPRGLSCWKYSGGKCEAENVLVQMAAKSCCNYTIVRPFVTYGNTRIPYSLAPAHGYDWTMIFRALAGKPIITWDGGRGRCNIMRVEDFCTGLLGLLKNEFAYGEAFNICGDESPCWKDVISTLEDVSGVKMPLIDLPKEFIQKHYSQRKEEIDGRSYEVFASNEKIKKLVPSFRSTISLRDGIARTVASYREGNFQNGVDWNFDAKCDEIINCWRRLQGQSGRMRFVNYLHDNGFGAYAKYLNAFSRQDLGFRLYRKCINAAAKFERAWK